MSTIKGSPPTLPPSWGLQELEVPSACHRADWDSGLTWVRPTGWARSKVRSPSTGHPKRLHALPVTVFPMMTLKLREVKGHTQGHGVSKGQSQNPETSPSCHTLIPVTGVGSA